MPKKHKTASPAPPRTRLSPSPTRALPPPASADDTEWRAKNARAKAIIMSTLIPGSEPWKIAEPLTLASDIWKALEDRYAPKNGEATADASALPPPRSERSDFVSEWVEGKSLEKYRTGARPGQMLTNFPADALMPEYNTALTAEEREAAILKRAQESGGLPAGETAGVAGTEAEQEALREEVRKEQRRKKAQADAARLLVEHMPNRDQRFLWALLHGGKEETMAWFNGTATT